jgi:hypothetical protein
MAIRFSAQAPIDARETVQDHLSRKQVNPRALVPMSTQERSLSEGIRSWSLDLAQAESGALDSAVPDSWRYLVFESNHPVAEAQVNVEAGVTKVGAMVRGPMAAGMAEALVVAGALPEVQTHDFEPRLLVVPSVTFVALWMHDDRGKDIYVPIPPSQLPLAHNEPFDASTVAAALKTAAAQVRAAMEAAPGPSGGGGGAVMELTPLELPRQPATTAATGGTASSDSLPEFMQTQEQTNWCWSAVATSVGLLFQSGGWRQCETATRCLSGVDCCANSAPCNVYGYLDKSMACTRSLASWGSGTATKARIKSDIRAGRPVCTRVAWTGGGAHFMAITGYDEDPTHGLSITIQDSIYGTLELSYADYPALYHGGGSWTHTYYSSRAKNAALYSKSKCYFFADGTYIRVTRGDTGPGTIDAGYPAKISNWKWGEFGKNGIDAALYSGSKCYFFSGDQYIRVTRGDTGPGTIDAGYPAHISNWKWGEFGKNGIDAALYSGSKCYFFSGDQYIRVTRGDTGPGTIDAGYPAHISNWKWGEFGKNGIDAALYSGSKCYFFCGDQYIRVTRGTTGPGTIDPGYPRPLSEWRWPAAFDDAWFVP